MDVNQVEQETSKAQFEEIKEITVLGDDKPLKWERTSKGLEVQMPDKQPTGYAHVIKIERYHHPRLK